jgi:hypothetical protein
MFANLRVKTPWDYNSFRADITQQNLCINGLAPANSLICECHFKRKRGPWLFGLYDGTIRMAVEGRFATSEYRVRSAAGGLRGYMVRNKVDFRDLLAVEGDAQHSPRK